jgi:hypothetical protein
MEVSDDINAGDRLFVNMVRGPDRDPVGYPVSRASVTEFLSHHPIRAALERLRQSAATANRVGGNTFADFVSVIESLQPSATRQEAAPPIVPSFADGTAVPAAPAFSDDESVAIVRNNPQLACPINRNLFRQPVLAADGHSYEYDDIAKWIATCDQKGEGVTSPMTGALLKRRDLVPNIVVMQEVAQKLEELRSREE